MTPSDNKLCAFSAVESHIHVAAMLRQNELMSVQVKQWLSAEAFVALKRFNETKIRAEIVLSAA